MLSALAGAALLEVKSPQYALDVALGLVEEPGRDEAGQEWREAVGLPT